MSKLAELLAGRANAVLDGLQPFDEQPFDGAIVAEALVCAGDLLRLGQPLPKVLTKWMKRVGDDELADGLDAVVADLEALVFPGGGPSPDELEVPVWSIDRAWSVDVGMLRVAMARCVPPGGLVGYVTFRHRLEQLVSQACACFDRESLEVALGDRSELLRSGSDWTEAVSPVGVGAVRGEAPLPEFVPDVLWAPPDEVVASYVASGVHRYWVESAAEAARDFAALLAAVIEDSETYALVPRRWLRDYKQSSPASASPIQNAPPLVKMVALAGPSPQGVGEFVPLGRLAPVRATASAKFGPNQAEICIDGEPGAVRRVVVDGSEVEAIRDRWCHVISPPSKSFRLLVEGSGGERFDEAIEFNQT